MLCPRCQSPMIDGSVQVVGRRDRSNAKVLACGRCRSAFNAHQAAATQRDQIFATHGTWFRVA